MVVLTVPGLRKKVPTYWPLKVPFGQATAEAQEG